MCDVPEFELREVGLLYAVACSSLPKDEVIARAKAIPCGTSGGWLYMNDDDFPEGLTENPMTCTDHPETHKHYFFVC